MVYRNIMALASHRSALLSIADMSRAAVHDFGMLFFCFEDAVVENLYIALYYRRIVI